MRRITGMDLKMEQYRKGERFVAGDRAPGRRRGPPAAVGRPRDRCRRRPRSTTPRAWVAAAAAQPARIGRTDRGVDAGTRAGPRTGRRARGHRPDADPVGPLPRRRTSNESGPPHPAREIVTVSLRGHGGRRLDDVEVMLRGRLPAETFDRILARAPNLRWVHSATAGVERVLTPASRERGLVITNARGVFSRADRRVRPDDDPGRRRAACRSCSSSSASARGSRSKSREMRDVTVGIVGLGSIGRAVGAPRDRIRLPGHRDTRRRPESAPEVTDRGRGTTRSLGSLMLDRVLPPERCPSCSPSRTSSCWRAAHARHRRTHRRSGDSPA